MWSPSRAVMGSEMATRSPASHTPTSRQNASQSFERIVATSGVTGRSRAAELEAPLFCSLHRLPAMRPQACCIDRSTRQSAPPCVQLGCSARSRGECETLFSSRKPTQAGCCDRGRRRCNGLGTRLRSQAQDSAGRKKNSTPGVCSVARRAENGGSHQRSQRRSSSAVIPAAPSSGLVRSLPAWVHSVGAGSARQSLLAVLFQHHRYRFTASRTTPTMRLCPSGLIG